MASFMSWSLVVVFCTCIVQCVSIGDHVHVKCSETERQALVAVRGGLTDPSGRLSSWDADEDCCEWEGVECDNITGHVVKLHLRNPFHFSDPNRYLIPEAEADAYESSCLGGEINPSLLHFQHLTHLDLSLNDFHKTKIPNFLGELKSLTYLNLSYASFAGEIPPFLGNLSSLQVLDLSSEPFSSGLRAESLQWLSGLSSLEHLDLGYVNLSSVGANWLQADHMLPSLLEMHLPSSSLQVDAFSLDFPWINLTSLSVLDVSDNMLKTSLPRWLFNLTSLTQLHLSKNDIMGPIARIANLPNLSHLDLSSNGFTESEIPTALGSLCHLHHLDLSTNKFSGELGQVISAFSLCPNNSLLSLILRENSLEGGLPESLGSLKNLQFLDLSVNSFRGSVPSSIGNLSFLKELRLEYSGLNGSIPETLGKLSELTHLELVANSWGGVVTEAHFIKLAKLKFLEVTTSDLTKSRSLVVNLTYSWVPPFMLASVHLENCLVGPRFPTWLRVQSSLAYVNIRNAGISDTIPEEWFVALAPQVEYIDLSFNQIKGKLPLRMDFKSPYQMLIDLSHNLIEGPFPLWSTTSPSLFLQSNYFSGHVPHNIDQLMPKLVTLHLFHNNFNGTVPQSLCKLPLIYLFLDDNQFTGRIPDCWNGSLRFGHAIDVIDMSNNSLSGTIPSSLGSLKTLLILALSDNDLEGQVPSSLQNCTSLVSLDLGGNRLTGTIPLWLGHKVSSIFMLSLRSNLFSGHVPSQLCNLQDLHLLDLSQNEFTGAIPKCLGSLTAMVKSHGNIEWQTSYGEVHMMVVAKGRELEYSKTVVYVNSIDLSGNQLTGRVPDEITSLVGLSILNLSRNHLAGRIPDNIGDLKRLETFDLSRNKLSGPIPQSLSSLTFLSHLDLSYNMLEGRIPTGYQLQTINEAAIYEGNPLLCGAPLPIRCQEYDVPNTNVGVAAVKHTKDKTETIWFGAGIGFGFVVGFSGACCVFLNKFLWGCVFLWPLDDITDKVALALASNFPRLAQLGFVYTPKSYVTNMRTHVLGMVLYIKSMLCFMGSFSLIFFFFLS